MIYLTNGLVSAFIAQRPPDGRKRESNWDSNGEVRRKKVFLDVPKAFLMCSFRSALTWIEFILDWNEWRPAMRAIIIYNLYSLIDSAFAANQNESQNLFRSTFYAIHISLFVVRRDAAKMLNLIHAQRLTQTAYSILNCIPFGATLCEQNAFANHRRRKAIDADCRCANDANKGSICCALFLEFRSSPTNL